MDGAVGVVDVAGEGLLGPSGHPGCSTLWGRGLSLRMEALSPSSEGLAVAAGVGAPCGPGPTHWLKAQLLPFT